MPRKTLPLTDVQIKNAKPQPKPLKLSDGDGLHILITPSGGKLWRLKYRHDGKEKLLSFGAWPEVSLKRARELRLEARSLVAGGVDPSEKRKQARVLEGAQAVVAANTFSVVAQEWHSKQSRRWSQDHATRVWSRIENHLLPAFGGIPIGVTATAPMDPFDVHQMEPPDVHLMEPPSAHAMGPFDDHLMEPV